MIKNFKLGLLAKVLIAIALGVLFGSFMPLWVARIFETINSIFSNYLGFIIPLIILGLVAPSITELGNRAGKLVLITAAIAYASTLFSGFLSYFTSKAIYPTLLVGDKFTSVNLDDKLVVSPYFSVDMPAVMGVTSALVLAFVLGLTLASFKNRQSSLLLALNDFRDVVMLLIEKSIIPLLPLYIFGIFLKLGVEGQVAAILSLFAKVIIMIFILHIALLLIQFTIAGVIAKKNPIKALITMLPAYMTALGTQSSAATIPVTLERTKLNGVDDDIAEFTVPLCATIHLSGSILKIVACTLAISWMTGMSTELGLYVGFIAMLGITMVAAPGVPGGAIMAALALLSSQLGFSDAQQGLMIALYIAMDSFGTAGNVAGDGAISMIVNKIYKK